jgi:hypothetical protein
MRRRFLVVALVSILVTVTIPLSALRYGDTTVVVPIIARTPGAGGSVWRTELWLANPYDPTATVTLRYYPAANPSAVQTFTTTLPRYSVRSFDDILLNQFGVSDGSGMLIVSCETTIEARARIYNSGSAAGQFGQNVPALGLAVLNRQAYLPGLSGVGGNRVNVGVANPTAVPVTLTMYIADRDNNGLSTQTVSLGAYQVIQYNDIFTRFGITPQADVQIDISDNFTAGVLIYGYASVVRNDSGDAVFIAGTSPNG